LTTEEEVGIPPGGGRSFDNEDDRTGKRLGVGLPAPGEFVPSEAYFSMRAETPPMPVIQRRRTAYPELMKATAENMQTGTVGQRQGGVFECDHSHDPTPSVDDEDEEGEEHSKANMVMIFKMFQQKKHHSQHKESDGVDESSSEDEAMRPFPTKSSSSQLEKLVLELRVYSLWAFTSRRRSVRKRAFSNLSLIRLAS
jgi:hypothetical protein